MKRVLFAAALIALTLPGTAWAHASANAAAENRWIFSQAPRGRSFVQRAVIDVTSRLYMAIVPTATAGGRYDERPGTIAPTTPTFA